MRHPLHRRRFCALALAAPALASPWARAAAWPTQPIRIVVPFPSGGSSDTVLRIVMDKLSPALGVPIILDNKPGASTQLGTDIVARATPDGQTLLQGSSTAFTILPHLRNKLPFDPQKDFAPIGGIAEYIGVAAVRKDLQVKTLAEFVALARQNPGKFSYGSPGVGTIGHIQGEILQRATGIQLLHVPFKGSADAVTALVGGQIDFLIDGAITPFVKNSRVQGLFTFSDKRRAEVPELPPLAELGFAVERPTGPTWALFAPAKTPPAVLAQLSQALEKVMADAQVREKLNASGVTPYWLPPAELAKAFEADRRFFGKLLPAIGVKPED
ncbi:MAG TPA: tripartite tricarboxylate transporter substrate binding protein [Pseudorhodoferax sp.]|nr:tripartite tricarboxylate transporter substrate binding protein [Pseudorhodoferax sp.]